jgi:hypothetical protein
MCFISMHRPVEKNLLLMQPRNVCTLLRMDIVPWVVGEWKSDSTLLLTSLYMLPTSQFVGMSSKENLHFMSQSVFSNSYTDVSTTSKWWCILPNRTCIFVSLGKNVGLHSVIKPKRFFKIRFSCPSHTHCVSYSLLIIVHIWQKNSDIKTTTMFPATTFFSL